MDDPQTGLTLLLDRASAERDRAALALRRAEAGLDAAAQQAGQLGGYRDQYRQRWGERFRVGGNSAALVHCHQGFGQRLDQAITLQQVQLGQAQSRLDAARAKAIACEQRVAAVRKLIERRGAQAQSVAARREQRATDEIAQRAAYPVPALNAP